MGSVSSNASNDVNFEFFFNSNEKTYFIIYPEDEIVNQNFDITKTDIKSHQKKKNYLLSAKNINEIFLNSSIITQEESQFNVLKKIIIPHFSRSLLTTDPTLIDSKLIFQYYESLNNLFLERHSQYLSNIDYLKIPEIIFSKEITSQAEESDLESMFNDKKKDYYLNFTFQPNHINSNNLIQFIEQNRFDKNYIVKTFFWSILHCDLKLLIISCQKLIELDKQTQENKKANKNIEAPRNVEAQYNQDLTLSNISIKHENLISFINYTSPFEINFKQKGRGSILAASSSYLFAFNFEHRILRCSKSFLKINLSNHNVTKIEQHFETIAANSESILRSIDYSLASVDNMILIVSTSNKLTLYNPNLKTQNKMVNITQNCNPLITAPFASDGHYIYSILNSKEVGIYYLSETHDELKLKNVISISYNKSKITNRFGDQIFPIELIENASFVTNGIVLQIIYPISTELNKFTHFSRVISLINCSHICDYEFDLPYPIHSISFEPLTRCLWTLSVYKNGACFNKFKYTGPEPLWASGLQITTSFPKLKKCNTISLFKDFAINYSNSIFAQFYGSEFHDDELMLNYFKSELESDLIDLIISILNQENDNIQFIQFLLIILSFQLKYVKMTKEQSLSLYDILVKNTLNLKLYSFLTLFIIHISSNLTRSDISKYFGLIFKRLGQDNIEDVKHLLPLLLRLEKHKFFAYILDNNCTVITSKIIARLCSEEVSEIETDFILTYLSSLFASYSQTLQKNPQDIQSIEMAVFGFTQHFVENGIIMLSSIDSIESFQKSSFISVFKKLLVFLKLTTHSSTFVWPILPNLLELLKAFPNKKFFKIDTRNPFYLFFMDIFFLYVYSFKQMLSFSDIEFLQKHSQFLNIKIGKEKTVSEIFNNQLNDDDFVQVIATIYSKVTNLLNRRLTNEDKETEKYLFLSLFYKTQTIQEIIDLSQKIKANEQIQILPQIKQIAQSVYAIRSNLRSKRQNNDQSEYNKLHKNIVEKSHFLLKFSSEKAELKSISSFISSNIQTSEIILAQSKLESVINSFSYFLVYADSFITQKLPINTIYLFIMHISDNTDIIDAYELVKKYTKIELKSSKDIIETLLKRIPQIPPNPILAFLCNLIIIIAKSREEQEIHDFLFNSLSKIIEKLCKESRFIDKIIFKSCISLICHLHRILNIEKYFIIRPNEVKSISDIFNNMDIRCSMSFTLEHSIYQGLFNFQKPINLIKSLIGYVGQPKFHSISLLIYDHLEFYSNNNLTNEFYSYFATLLDIIGTVLSGANSDYLLQIAAPVSELNKSPEKAYCRTPTSQLACILDIIQIVRRLILNKESNSARLIKQHFKAISETFYLNNKKGMKQIFAMFAILSNIFEIIRPYTIVTNDENKSYFITSFDEPKKELKGLLLPITNQQIISHSFENTDDLKSFEIIPYKPSMISDLEISHTLFEPATNLEMTQYSDCLYTFYALQCVKENILDTENGAEFSNMFFSQMKKPAINHFMFRENAPLILSLLKKSLTIPTDGIFVGSPVKPQFYHASFTQLEFKNDYNVTENVIESYTTPHVFISSIIDDNHLVYFQINYESLNQQFDFGVITHSVDQNQSVSVTYSTHELGFCINGEKVSDYRMEEGTLIECRYHPLKNKVSFADSKSTSRCFSFRLLTKSQCSFIALVHPGTKINYDCTFNPSTDCFQKNIHLRQFKHPTKLFSKVKQKLFTKKVEINEDETKFSMMVQADTNEQNSDIVIYTKAINKIQNNAIAISVQNEGFDTSHLYSLAQFDNVRETALLLAIYPDSSFSSIMNIYSSPIQLENYVQIHEVSGQFDFIQSKLAGIVNENIIPPFHFQKYHHLPVEVINCYFSGVCEFHRQEILTLLAARILANSTDVTSSLNQLSITTKLLVNFVTSILLILEPIKLSNLNEGKSPIDFESFNGLETCVKTNLYDYYSCLNKIITFLQTNGKDEFIMEWFNQLENDFQNKYMHFATQKNTSLITVRSLIIDTYQNFNIDDVSGWIIFPITFGLYKMPSILVNHMIFPKSFDDSVNYACSEGKSLRIMGNYKHSRLQNYTDEDFFDLLPFGILPCYINSNQSLFYSFYHLAVSFKYFVLFSHQNLNDNYKIKIRKLVFDSIIAGSPFFYTHSDTVLPFLSSKLFVPFCPEYMKLLNIFIFSTSHIRHNGIIQFINQQMSLAEDLKSAKFRYFISDSDPVPHSIVLPQQTVPPVIDISKIDLRFLFVTVSRALKLSNENNAQFPFHLILSEWAESFCFYPPCDLRFAERNVLEITFLSYIPKSFQLFDLDFDRKEKVHVSFTGNFNESYKKFEIGNIETDIRSLYALVTTSSTNNKIFVKFHCYENVTQHNFTIFTTCLKNKPKNIPQLAYECRSCFINDLNEWSQSYTEEEDQKILNNCDAQQFERTTISTRPEINMIGKLNNQNHQAHLNYLRFIYLISFNFLISKDKSLMTIFGDDSLKRFYSLHFLSDSFLSLIRSDDSYKSMHIDRQKGLDVRNGISNNISNSLIGQFTSEYIPTPQRFRNRNHPFSITYKNERGIDAGGLMRDFISELIRDINEPRIGLFIQTPNGRNHEGKYQDCIVPSPSPVISRSDRYYQTIGALLGIATRTGMKQPDLLFPPLIWRFIISGNLKIEDVYEVDKAYKVLTSNIHRASLEMSDEEFENSMTSVTVLNLRGTPINLDRRVISSSNLSRSNCERFIAMCNQSRINELLLPLQKIRTGFWENLNINPPPFATPSLIQFLACGERIITADDLQRRTHFRNIDNDQQRFFLEIIHRMTNEERKQLLHFATGLTSLTREGLKVDHLFGSRDSRLPTASTCFFTLHLPNFSSADRMYRAFLIAIYETGTFEES